MAAGTIRAELKSLFSPDADPLTDFRPNGPFGILVMAIVGPIGVDGRESFDFTLCTLEWFEQERMANRDFVLGRHTLFVKEFSYPQLERFVREFCSSCEGDTWSEVALKVGRLGKWEFEDYVP